MVSIIHFSWKKCDWHNCVLDWYQRSSKCFTCWRQEQINYRTSTHWYCFLHQGGLEGQSCYYRLSTATESSTCNLQVFLWSVPVQKLICSCFKELVVLMATDKTRFTVAAGLKAVSSRLKEKLSYLEVLLLILFMMQLQTIIFMSQGKMKFL